VNSKNLFTGICVALLIISEVMLIMANGQKSAAQAQLRSAKQQIADLQSQLEEATNGEMEAENTELVRLRADNQDLPRLRKEILQLLADNRKLSEQLGQTSDAAQQQQQQLEDMQAQQEQAAEEQQAQAQATEEVAERITAARRNTCIGNLRLIYAAKQAWALEKNKTDADLPTEEDLLPYIKGGVFPACPSGGVYTIGTVGQPPTCSVTGHVLPAQ
jgi:hypothetical protein